MSKRNADDESSDEPPMKKAQLGPVSQDQVVENTKTTVQKSIQTDQCNSKFKSFVCSLIDGNRRIPEFGRSLQYPFDNLVGTERFEAMEVDDYDPQ